MTLADSRDIDTPAWKFSADLFDTHPELALRSRGWTSEDRREFLAHLGRENFQGSKTRDFASAWIKDPDTEKHSRSYTELVQNRLPGASMLL
uniref:hypothetical protein n=1 Tax=Corynebacterium glutamicum TaxID=1718 RepID=UPI00031FF096|nr:hypothetical protein [Corynebacterium glutamicum]